MKQKTQKTIHENGIKSPTRNDQNANQNGKIIFNKFDLIQDPVEKAKLENQVIFLSYLTTFKGSSGCNSCSGNFTY